MNKQSLSQRDQLVVLPHLGYLGDAVCLQAGLGQFLQQGSGDSRHKVEVVLVIELSPTVLTHAADVLRSWHYKVHGHCVRYLLPWGVNLPAEWREDGKGLSPLLSPGIHALLTGAASLPCPSAPSLRAEER